MLCFLKSIIVFKTKYNKLACESLLRIDKIYEKKIKIKNSIIKMVNEKEEKSSEDFPVSFLKEIIDETKMVEWPSVEKLFKQFVIVVISLVVSAFLIFSVDGIFASLSQFLFEGNAISSKSRSHDP